MKMNDNRIILKFIENILSEINKEFNSLELSFEEKDALIKSAFYRVFEKNQNIFFNYHITPYYQRIITSAFSMKERPKTLEIGCGSGTASLLLALLGANAVAIDNNEDVINACKKRKDYYQRIYGDLSLEFIKTDAFEHISKNKLDYDLIFFMFSFNMMKPHIYLLKILLEKLRKNTKIIIIDGNPHSLYNKILRKRQVLKINAILELFGIYNFEVKNLFFRCILPPQLVFNDWIKTKAIELEKIINRFRIAKHIGTSYYLECFKE